MSERILTKRRLLAVASALPVLSAFASARAQAPTRRRPHQRLLRSDARALQGDQRGLRQAVEGQDRPEGDDPRVARRLGQAGALGDRRAGGRRRDAGAGRRHRRHRPRSQAACRRTGRSACRTTPRPTPRPSCSWCARAIRRASRTGPTSPSPASPSSRPTPRPPAARAGTISPPGPTSSTARKGDAGDRRASSSRRSIKNVPVLDTGARGSTTTFAQRAIGDVLITWENEAFLILQEFGADKFEIVVPPFSILAEPPVALVDAMSIDKAARARWRRPISSSSTRRRRRRSSPSNFYRPSKPDAADPGRPRALPEDQAGHHRRGLRRLGARRRASISPMAAVFDQIYKPSGKPVTR